MSSGCVWGGRAVGSFLSILFSTFPIGVNSFMVYMAYKDLYQMSNTEVGPHLWLWLCVIGLLSVKMAAVLCNPSSGPEARCRPPCFTGACKLLSAYPCCLQRCEPWQRPCCAAVSHRALHIGHAPALRMAGRGVYGVLQGASAGGRWPPEGTAWHGHGFCVADTRSSSLF